MIGARSSGNLQFSSLGSQGLGLDRVLYRRAATRELHALGTNGQARKYESLVVGHSGTRAVSTDELASNDDDPAVPSRSQSLVPELHFYFS